MNLSQTLDVAAQMMAHAGHLTGHSALVNDNCLHSYWAFSRDLTQHWMQNLTVCQKILERGDPIRSRQCWLEYEPDLRDILRADVLHRVWYTILRTADATHRSKHAEPIGRSVLCAQLQVRIRALRLILAGHQFDAARMKSLNGLRRNAEAWSDFLCGFLALKYNIQDVLFDPERAKQYGRQPLDVVFPELKNQGACDVLSDLNWKTIQQETDLESTNSLRQLVKHILNCFPETAFDSAGDFVPVK